MSKYENVLRAPQISLDEQVDSLLEWAPDYIAAGWEVIPVPFMEKSPIPSGCTGYHGKPIERPRLEHLIRKGIPFQVGERLRYRRSGGLALRMPPGVIGIDVDAYKDTGSDSLADLQKLAGGPLPDTWVSTSRDDGVSGIRFYRIPPTVACSPNPFPGIEVIQRHHRYAVVAPSFHPSGKQYHWLDPGGGKSDDFPSVKELPWLFGGPDER